MTRTSMTSSTTASPEQLSAIKQLGEPIGRDVFAVALSRVKPTKGEAQKIFEQGDALRKPFFNAAVDALVEQMQAVASGISLDPQFALLANLGIIEVPNGYQHGKRLDAFAKDHGKEFDFFHDGINDANFAKATTRLEPGRKLHVFAWGSKPGQPCGSRDCLKFISRQGGILTGAQGASLVYEQKRDQLSKGKQYASFDEKTALWEDDAGFHCVPCMSAYSNGDFGFYLSGFGNGFGHFVILVFRDEPSEA